MLHWGFVMQRTSHSWASYKVLDNSSPMGGSVSVRWDPRHDDYRHIIAAIHDSEDHQHNKTYLPRLNYQAVTPSE